MTRAWAPNAYTGPHDANPAAAPPSPIHRAPSRRDAKTTRAEKNQNIESLRPLRLCAG